MCIDAARCAASGMHSTTVNDAFVLFFCLVARPATPGRRCRGGVADPSRPRVRTAPGHYTTGLLACGPRGSFFVPFYKGARCGAGAWCRLGPGGVPPGVAALPRRSDSPISTGKESFSRIFIYKVKVTPVSGHNCGRRLVRSFPN